MFKMQIDIQITRIDVDCYHDYLNDDNDDDIMMRIA